jgi:hypothetical protein
VALFCADALAKGLAENVSDTEWGGFLKKVQNYVKESGRITHRALLHRFNAAKRRDFQEAVIQLIESGVLNVEEQKASNGKVTKIYSLR